MKKVKLTKNIDHALLVDEDGLAGLIELLNSKYSRIHMTASCEDSYTIETDSVNELLEYENPDERRIKELSIAARREWDESVTIRIDGSPSLGGARFDLTSTSSDEPLLVSSAIEEQFRGMRPSYARLAEFHAWLWYLSIMCCLLVLPTLLGWVGYIESKPIKPLTVVDIGVVGFFVLVLFASAWMVQNLQGWLFPMCFFFIGRQKTTMDRREKWRYFLFYGVIVALSVGVASSLIAWFITRQTS